MGGDAGDLAVGEGGRVYALIAVVVVHKARRAQIAQQKHGGFDARVQKGFQRRFITRVKHANR